MITAGAIAMGKGTNKRAQKVEEEDLVKNATGVSKQVFRLIGPGLIKKGSQ